jgi:phytoene dehydrogenase-like protein
VSGRRSAIVHENVQVPLGWREAYGLHQGAAFGLRHNLAQMSMHRPPHAHHAIPNLYYAGASTRYATSPSM